MRTLPSLQSLRVFEAAARLESITLAGEALGLTQSAVSKQVAQLEALLGQRLFRRDRRSIALTEAGRRVAWIAATTLADLSTRLDEVVSPGVDSLRLAVDADFSQLWLFPKLPGFYRRHPEVTLSLRSDSKLTAPPERDYDCALLWGRGDWRSCRFRPLFTNTVFPVAAPGFLPKAEAPLAGLSARDLIHDRSSYWWASLLASVGSSVDPELGNTYSSTALCLDAAARGDGVTVGDEVSSRHYLETGRLVVPCDLRLPSPEAYYLAQPKSAPRHEAVNLFVAWLIEEAEAHKGWYGRFWSELAEFG
ncbi:MAG: transcriptional regulator GcvA [Rhodospirillales bacterium]